MCRRPCPPRRRVAARGAGPKNPIHVGTPSGGRHSRPYVTTSLALILRNVWVWCHLNWLAERHGLGVRLRDELLRLQEMTLWLQQLIIAEFGLLTLKPIDDRRRWKTAAPAQTAGKTRFWNY